MELFVETGGMIWDMSELCTELSWTDVLNDGAGYLEFSYCHDGILIGNGAPVRLTEDNQGKGVFYGTVFKVETGRDRIVKVKAYDRLRYLKAKETIVSDGDTLNSLVKKACGYFEFPLGENTPTGHVLPDAVNTDKTWLDIIYTGIKDTLLATEHTYCLRDENGTVCLRDLADLQLPLVLGDGSLAHGYSYSASIDGEFYNAVKLVLPSEKNGNAAVFRTADSASIEKYGFLQYYEVLDKDTASSRARDRASVLLRLYNRELETLSLSCLGDMSVRAGCSIFGSIADIGLERRLIVGRVTHKFLPAHTMEVEVMI